MKYILSRSIVVALASAATLATQASAAGLSGLLPDGTLGEVLPGFLSTPAVSAGSQLYANSGSLTIAAPTIVGTNSATAQKHQAVTVFGHVEYLGDTEATTNRRGIITTKTPVIKEAYGNKEILQGILGTNVVSGWRLVATNAFTNANIATKVVALKTTNAPVQADNFIIIIEDQILGNTTVRQTNGTISQNDGKGLSSFALVVLDLEFPGTGKTVYNDLASHEFINGTNRATNTYFSERLKGTFQGIAELLPETSAIDPDSLPIIE